MSVRDEFADVCREGGLAFMRGAAKGWDEPDLERWRASHFALVAVPAPALPVSRASIMTRILTFPDLLRETRWKVSAALEEAARGRARFVRELADDRVIVRDEKLGWVPVDRPGTSLRRSVLALFAVDCLQRVDDYRTKLFVCPRCETITFDADARVKGHC